MTVLLKVAHDGTESQIFATRSCSKIASLARAFSVAAKADLDGVVMCLANVAPWSKFVAFPLPTLPRKRGRVGRGMPTGG